MLLHCRLFLYPSLCKFVLDTRLVPCKKSAVISLRPVCLGRLLPTDISHRTICYGSVSRSDQSLTKRSHHVSQAYTLFSGLENSRCSGPPKVRKLLDVWSATECVVEMTQGCHCDQRLQLTKCPVIFCKFLVCLSQTVTVRGSQLHHMQPFTGADHQRGL